MTPDSTRTTLVEKHSEIWELMGLSPGAARELNRIVVDLRKRLAGARRARDARSEPQPEVKRAEHELTREEFLERHRQRFAALGVTVSTQAELLDAAAFTWRATHDGSVPPGELEVAETIREMMLAMGGPPPCCDDSVLESVGQAPPCS